MHDEEGGVLQAVGERLSIERIRVGLTVEAAADAAGVDADRLACAEAGETALDDAEIGRIADVYGVATTAFFGGRITPFSYLAGA